MVEITKLCVKEVTHPGINYFVKHIGVIFRRLFPLALKDLSQGEEFSSMLKLLPLRVEGFLIQKYDDMLWSLLVGVAEKTHCALEPMYSTVDPNLPTFVYSQTQHSSPLFIKDEDGQYLAVQSPGKKAEEEYFASFKARMLSLISGSGVQAKCHLREENRQRAMQRKSFLSDERTSMITDDETNQILQRSFEYITALMEFNLVNLKFQFNHYLYEGFKQELRNSFSSKLISDTDWESLVEKGEDTEQHLAELDQQIVGLRESVRKVANIQSRVRQ